MPITGMNEKRNLNHQLQVTNYKLLWNEKPNYELVFSNYLN